MRHIHSLDVFGSLMIGGMGKDAVVKADVLTVT